MAMDVVRLGAVTLDEETGAPVVAADIPIDGEDDNSSNGLPQLDMMPSLGLSAVPATSDEDGYAEGVVARGLNGSPGVVIGGRDSRTASVIGNLAAGETCLHSTGKGMDSRVVCKDQSVSILVGEPAKMIATFNQAEQKIQITGFGHMFEMSAAQGICMKDKGGGLIQINGGAVTITGSSVVIGNGATPTPASGASYGPGAIGKPGSAQVFIGP